MRTAKKPAATGPDKHGVVKPVLSFPYPKGVKVIWDEAYGDYFIECRTAKASRELIDAIWNHAQK